MDIHYCKLRLFATVKEAKNIGESGSLSGNVFQLEVRRRFEKAGCIAVETVCCANYNRGQFVLENFPARPVNVGSTNSVDRAHF